MEFGNLSLGVYEYFEALGPDFDLKTEGFKDDYYVDRPKHVYKNTVLHVTRKKDKDGKKYCAKLILKNAAFDQYSVNKEFRIAYELGRNTVEHGDYNPFIRIHAMYVEDSVGVYVIFEEGDGGSLKEQISAKWAKDKKSFGEGPIAKKIIRGILRGLAIMWERGLIHASLKPANIILSKQNAPYIIDFGTSVTIGAAPGAGASFFYKAPEVFTYYNDKDTSEEQKLGKINSSCDKWSFAITLIETVFGPLKYELFMDPENFAPGNGLTSSFFKWKDVPMASLKKASNELLDLILRLLEFDVTLREKYCQNLDEHPWFTGNENVKFQTEIRLLEQNASKRKEPYSVPVYVAIKRREEELETRVPSLKPQVGKVLWGTSLKDLKTWILTELTRDEHERNIKIKVAQNAKDAHEMSPDKMDPVDADGEWELEYYDINTINCLVVYY